MLTIKEICARTGVNHHTFQSWRRDGLKLLPKPVAVQRNFIFFDDSILERVRFIKEQRESGKTVREINEVFKSYYAFLKDAESSDQAASSLKNVLGELDGCEAELQVQLKRLEADFRHILEVHAWKTARLFRDFQEAMVEGNLSAFLEAMSANGLACRDQSGTEEVSNSQGPPSTGDSGGSESLIIDFEDEGGI